LAIGDVETIGHGLEDIPQLDAKTGEDRDKHDRDAGAIIAYSIAVTPRSDLAKRIKIRPRRLYARDRRGVYQASGAGKM
jgi:hypothetical protein